MKKATKQDDLNRIRTDGPLPGDFTDERPRVRRAALVMLAKSEAPERREAAMQTAAKDPSDAVHLSTARAYMRSGAAALLATDGGF